MVLLHLTGKLQGDRRGKPCTCRMLCLLPDQVSNNHQDSNQRRSTPFYTGSLTCASQHSVNTSSCTLHHTTPYSTRLHHTTPYRTRPHRIVPHRTVLYHTAPHHIAPHHTTTPHRTRTTPYRTRPHHTTPHRTTPNHITPQTSNIKAHGNPCHCLPIFTTQVLVTPRM